MFFTVFPAHVFESRNPENLQKKEKVSKIKFLPGSSDVPTKVKSVSPVSVCFSLLLHGQLTDHMPSAIILKIFLFHSRSFSHLHIFSVGTWSTAAIP